MNLSRGKDYMDMKSKVERMKALPALKMKSIDLQRHLQEFREKLRRQKLIDEIQPITGVQINKDKKANNSSIIENDQVNASLISSSVN